ncbi:MAG: S41 family peptidase [Saprospiraceae bacterium]
MKRLFAALLVIALLVPAALRAQKRRVFTPEEVRADLDFLQAALYRGHPGVFKYTPRDSMDAFFQKLRDRLPADSVTRNQAQLIIRLAVANVRDGHTSVETPFYDDNTEVLPLTVQVIGGKAFIIKDYAGDTLAWRGAEIRAVNGILAGNVIVIGRLIAFGDGYSDPFRDVSASVFFARNFRLLFGTPKENRVELVWPDGRIETRRLLSRPRKEILALQMVQSANPNQLRAVFRSGDMALFRDTLYPDMAILQMGSFPGRHYAGFYRKTFRWLRQQHIRHLVIDLRYNTGGNLGNLEMLLEHILDEPTSYQYERRRRVNMGPYFNTKGKLMKGLVWLKLDVFPGYRHHRKDGLKIRQRRIKPHRRHNFDGNVYVLTNGWSFSSASMAASFLKYRGGATVIGTETGGSATGNCGGGYPLLVLPHTGIKVRFPLNYVRYDVGQPNKGRGVLPDWPVEYRMEDVLQRKDLEMEQVYRILKNK